MLIDWSKEVLRFGRYKYMVRTTQKGVDGVHHKTKSGSVVHNINETRPSRDNKLVCLEVRSAR